MLGCWAAVGHTSPDMIRYMRSLSEVNNTGDHNGMMELVRTEPLPPPHSPLALSGAPSCKNLNYILYYCTCNHDVMLEQQYCMQ